MPSVFKAPYVTVEGRSVPIETAHHELLEQTAPATANTAVQSNAPIQQAKIEGSILDGARSEAENILLQAKNGAQAIANEAKAEMERLRAEVEASAREKGHKEGYMEGSAQAESLKKEAEETLKSAREQREEMLADMAPEAAGLIIKILEKLVGKATSINPGVILHLVREGLSETLGAGGIKIHVSPESYNVAVEHLSDIKEWAGARETELVKDASLDPAGCVIETPSGDVDSGLERQFEALKSDLLALSLEGAQ